MNSAPIKLSPDRIKALLEAARGGLSRAFLTSRKGTSYGAAALTANGRIFVAGQYLVIQPHDEHSC